VAGKKHKVVVTGACGEMIGLIRDGLREIPIEERDAREVRYVEGLIRGEPGEVLVTSPGSPAANYGFDVTPARLITALITEEGVLPASEEALEALAPGRSAGV